MRKQAEDEKTSVMMWNAVVDALQKHIQFHGEWAAAILDYDLTEAHRQAQRQALDQGVQALIAFVRPPDD